MNRIPDGGYLIWWFIVCLCFTFLWPESGAAQAFFEDVTEEVMDVSELFTVRVAAFGDYNNDGWPDLFLSETIPDKSWRNRVALLCNESGRRFVDGMASIQADIPSEIAKGASVLFGDYDNDGDLDLFIPMGGWAMPGLNMLLRNDRGRFRDVALEAGLTEVFYTDNAIWLDYDRDGDLDLHLGDCWKSESNKLHRNNGDGTFTNVTEEAGLKINLGGRWTDGSNGGMSGGDFNDDGWPDLYVGEHIGANRLFLNDGAGAFWDATTDEIGDLGEAYGVAIGDIDNDGDLDIFQAAGGSVTETEWRSLMLLNLGEGQFLDVTEGVGVSGPLAAQLLSASLGDIDNDGDLDLLTAMPHYLYLNKGDVTFVDTTSQSGILEALFSVSFGDYDLDGFLDVMFGQRLYRNRGNGNHWLRVEVVGIESNRDGIGARLVATSGDLMQMREILGGLGFTQEEMVAHFGLGSHRKVDRLEIRWPSGGVDVLEDIPADQKIRAFEGREGYHVVQPTVWEWEDPLPDTLLAGSTVDLTAALEIHPALFEADAQILQIRADLSEIGGSSEVPLKVVGEDRYRLESAFTVGPNGWRNVSILIEQETSVGLYWTGLSRSIAVLPSDDMVIYEDGVGAGWSVKVNEAESDLMSSTFVNTGEFSHGILLSPSGGATGNVVYVFDDPGGVDLFGYTHLEFYINGGEASGQDPAIADRKLSDLGIVPQSDIWALVSIPISALPLSSSGRLTRITISGLAKETFYIDDMKLMAYRMEEPPMGVEASEQTGLPSDYALSQNIPNPFNPRTTIAYDLPQAADVTLTIYTITGQKVGRLVSGHQEGGHYEVMWDGKGFGSGIYFYRLKAGSLVKTRSMVLLK